MKSTPSRPAGTRQAGKFAKVGSCLYRYSSNGVYYARIKKPGKELRQSLRTTDRELAKRRLADLHRSLGRIDRHADRLTLAELCDRYLATVRHQAPKTQKRKRGIAQRVRQDWPGGADQLINRVTPSQVATWLSSYQFGSPSYNLYLEFIRAAFALAVQDRLLADSPVTLKTRKRVKPIRKTPTWEEFRAIVTDIRGQVYNADAAKSADFLEFIALSGLGQAEASSLCWGHVDWRRGQISTYRHKTLQGFMIPIYPQLRPLLERLKETRGAKRDNGVSPADEKVLRIKDVKHALSNACHRLNLPAYSQRAFRRMFITRAIERGVDVKVIAEWQGHRDGGKLILDTYSHVAPKHSARMAALMTEHD